LVEPVAEAPQHLGDQQGGGDGVREGGEGDALVAGHQPYREGAAGDAAVDREPALPDVQHGDRVAVRAEEGLRGGQHVPDAGADDPGDHRDEDDVEQGVPVAAAPLPALGGPPQRHRDPGEDAQGVEVDRQRPEGERGDRGAGDHVLSPQLSVRARSTPPRRSSATAARAVRAAASSPSCSSSARTKAEPTITPSAYEPTSAACSPFEPPSPTQTVFAPAARVGATRPSVAFETLARVPVTPIVLAA